MAGNPFRRPGAVPSTLATGREGAGELSIDTSDTTVKPKKVVKKVRIQSPIISPDDPPDDPFGARLNEQQAPEQSHPGSPQPPQDPEPDIATQLRRSFIDSVAKGASNLNREAVGQLPPQSSGMGLGLGMGTDAAASRVAQQQAPFNPFSRTLASIEGGYGPTVPTPTMDQPKTIETHTGIEQAGQSAKATARPAMDVDSFTRMLMTGTPAPAPAPASTSAAPPRQALSTPPISIEGTSTETSSLSKQSMFDQVHDLHPESPRSSYDSFRSEDVADHNEHSSLVGGTRERKAKPPPPTHHRGKLLSSKGPQTVSFADFDASIDPTSERKSSASPIPDSSRSRPGRSPSDLNKPLPPPPSIASQSSSPTLAENPIISPAPLSSTQEGDETQARKARPPPPPTSRRTSQMRVDHPTGRTRSNSQLSKSSIADDLDDHQTSFPSAVKPPPPPSRRIAGSISSADRENTVAGPSRSVPDTTSNVPTGKAPPPPPSRQSLRGTPTIARTPSTQSISSTSNRRVSPSLGQGQAPPPPPPPRRGDKRSSLDGINIGPISRRASNSSQRSSVELHRSRGASLNHGRAPSISSLQHVPESEAGQDTSQAEQDKGKDILADLSAFQAEIDALRAQIEG